MPFPLPETRCALTAPFHPYQRAEACRRFAFCCTGRHENRSFRARTLSGTVFSGSPDFPPLFAKRRPSGLLAGGTL